MRDQIKKSLYACGTAGLPKTAYVADRRWTLERTFKHDFFAATGLYQATDTAQDQGVLPERIVLKISRVQSFCGIPMAWIGRVLKNREYRLLESVQSLNQVPRLLGQYGRNGFAYRYIEGQSLDERPPLPDTFFDDLKRLLKQIHNQGICYLDFNKRGNILIGADKRPYMIDFQISVRLHRRWSRWLRHTLQREDYYHLLKHKLRFRSDLMSDSEKALAQRRSMAIRIHRFLTVPLRTARRRLLGLLHRKGMLADHENFEPTPENDPARFKS